MTFLVKEGFKENLHSDEKKIRIHVKFPICTGPSWEQRPDPSRLKRMAPCALQRG